MSGQKLRLLSYNVQVGISTRRPHHYVTHSWKHLLPHTQRISNLDKVANLLKGFDIIGLQELDAGSIRSNYINLVEYLAYQASFPYWYHQVNRNLGRFAQHSNGLLSHYLPTEVKDINLPALIPGRNAILARYGSHDASLAVIVMHLSLSPRARAKQLGHISEVVNEHKHAIVMGDMNCKYGSKEMRQLFSLTDLREPVEETFTFPSWRPQHHIDHILVTSGLKVENVKALTHPYSDHLPIMMELAIPDEVVLARRAA
ncbi:MAG: endonuclease/exonuclease/phosphatase family protein [Thioalkalispiraceae bacterium]|jgi:endonuclease/exonuclease/phosphatase family metal-dependent hydrolase